MLNLDLKNLDFASVVLRLARGTQGFGGSMSGRPFAAYATSSVPHGKILLLGAFAALLVVVAVPILFRVDVPAVAANSTLKCYDSAGNAEPCVTRASASPSQDDPTTGAQPASWTTTALYQQVSLATSAVDQPANWTKSTPAVRRSTMPGKRPGSTDCGRRFIPCFFSSLRRGLTHIASVAASVGQARPAREHL
jgi:hypothetical protein